MGLTPGGFRGEPASRGGCDGTSRMLEEELAGRSQALRSREHRHVAIPPHDGHEQPRIMFPDLLGKGPGPRSSRGVSSPPGYAEEVTGRAPVDADGWRDGVSSSSAASSPGRLGVSRNGPSFHRCGRWRAGEVEIDSDTPAFGVNDEQREDSAVSVKWNRREGALQEPDSAPSAGVELPWPGR